MPPVEGQWCTLATLADVPVPQAVAVGLFPLTLAGILPAVNAYLLVFLLPCLKVPESLVSPRDRRR